MKKYLLNIVKKFLHKSFNGDASILNIKNNFNHSIRSFTYGFRKIFVDAIDCHATPGTIESTILQINKLDKKGNLLNLGGGVGQVSSIFRSLGFSVYNIDIEIKKENENQFNLNCNLNEIDRLPFNDEFFDVIVCQEIIEHIENPWKLFRDVKTVLNRDGLFILSTPNPASIISRFKFLFTGFFSWFDQKCFDFHINPLFDWEIKLIAEKNNFEIINEIGSGEYYFKKDKKSRLLKNEGMIYILKNK